MNLTPIVDITSLDSQKLLAEAKQIADSIGSWKRKAQHTYTLKNKKLITVPVYATELNNNEWFARVSDFHEFDSGLKQRFYDFFVKYILGSTTDLTKTHSEYELKYIHEVYDYKVEPYELAGTDPATSFTYLLRSYYKFPSPLKKRIFYELVHIYKSPDSNEGYVITLALDPKNFLDPHSNDLVVAKYTSIERFSFIDDKLNWLMCTCSTPGGWIPNWMVNLSITGAIAKDVPSFLDWAETL